jgi:hypothetical protein
MQGSVNLANHGLLEFRLVRRLGAGHYANENKKLNFFVSRIGCEDSPFGEEQMGQLFANAPENCSLPRCWKIYAHAKPTSLIEVSG